MDLKFICYSTKIIVFSYAVLIKLVLSETQMQEQVPPETENLKKPDDYKCGDCGDFFPSKAKL